MTKCQWKVLKNSNALKVFDGKKLDFPYANGAGIFTGDVVLVYEQCGQVSSKLERVSCVNIFGFRKWPKVFDEMTKALHTS